MAGNDGVAQAVFQDAHNQAQSSFCRDLPAEIRLLVYRFYFECYRIHIIHEHNSTRPKITGLLCTTEGMSLESCTYLSGQRREYASRHGYSLETFSCDVMDFLKLARTCRSIYGEFIPFLYSSSFFAFEDPTALSRFTERLQTPNIAENGLRFVQRLHIFAGRAKYGAHAKEMKTCLEILARDMIGLKELFLDYYADVRIDLHQYPLIPNTIKLLGRLRGLRSFKLRIDPFSGWSTGTKGAHGQKVLAIQDVVQAHASQVRSQEDVDADVDGESQFLADKRFEKHFKKQMMIRKTWT